MPLNWLKLLPYILGGVLTIGLGWKAVVMVKNFFIDAENTRITLSNARIDHERTKAELSTLEATTKLEEEHEAAMTIIKAKHSGEMSTIRDEVEVAKAVLADRARLQRLSAERPTLMAKKANRASEKVFNELEAIYND